MLSSFGSPQRIDYGTGHEATFLVFLLALHKAGVPLELADIAALVFPRYFAFIRALVAHYRLEPAGSHGVWSLDDYHFVPFVLGSAQLASSDGRATSPRALLADGELVKRMTSKFLYCQIIDYIAR